MFCEFCGGPGTYCAVCGHDQRGTGDKYAPKDADAHGLKTLVRVRSILNCTVVQCVTARGVTGYVAVKGKGRNVGCVGRVLARHQGDPAFVRVRAYQL